MKLWTSRVLGLLLCVHFGTAMSRPIPCGTHPSSDYKDVGLKCSGLRVTEVPKFLPSSLKLLLLNNTGIPSLDNSTFAGRGLVELTNLAVTGGSLASVGPHAFRSLPALAKLDLSDNKLDRLDPLSFTSNKQLRSVIVSHNPSLRHLPPFDSSYITTMYVDNCNLKNVDVAAVKGMTALRVLSLIGNRDLDCTSEKKRLEQAVPDLLVFCDDSVDYHRPHPPAGDRESPPLDFRNNTQSTIYQKDVENTASPTRLSVWTMMFFAVLFHYIFLCCI